MIVHTDSHIVVDSTVWDAILWRNTAELYRLGLPSTDDANSAFHFHGR